MVVKIFTKDKWIMGEDIPNLTFDFSQLWCSSFANEM